MSKTVIHWFKNDLRLADNPALIHAAKAGTVIPIFIWDDSGQSGRLPGGASRWWLHHSLTALDVSLGGKLNIYRGNPAEILPELCRRFGASHVTWNCGYEPERVAQEEMVAEILEREGVEVHVRNGTLLWDPMEALKADGTPYRVFTPFFKKGCLGAAPPRKPTPPPEMEVTRRDNRSLSIDDLNLLPRIPWDEGFHAQWTPGEAGALETLEIFLKNGLDGYKTGRDFPARKNVSRLSPYLHWGEISPNQIWYAVKDTARSVDTDHFHSELGWREFSYHLLFHFPDLPTTNLNRKFDTFPWEDDPQELKAWQQGQTGIPLVDAGMRELWHTGYMHNRVRMVVASFLVKNLLIHWHHGEKWFWDTLVDADPANNCASWQWVAGCGADAAPYFRIFNPVTQGRKFDPDGSYVRAHVPEIANLPDKYLFCPWEAPADTLMDAGIELGKDYPKPIVDLKASREQALAAYAMLKESN
jgi:deoxyribodipyrimidine photo-lyase